MREIAPGLHHWTAKHPKIGIEVSSYFIADSATLLDPTEPPDVGMAWFRDDREPRAIVLTNRHHDRDSARYCSEFGIQPVLVPEAGLHEFEHKDLDVVGYVPEEEVVPGIVAHEVGGLAPDDMALEIRSVGALAMADALVHVEDGVRFVRDSYMDDPEGTKRALETALEELLDLDFDILLFAHGEPIVGGGKQVLRNFLAARRAE
jgi:glyoxylase-like metal-dependent hydrolase (beta-lactamase superfamily II)